MMAVSVGSGGAGQAFGFHLGVSDSFSNSHGSRRSQDADLGFCLCTVVDALVSKVKNPLCASIQTALSSSVEHFSSFSFVTVV